MVRCAIAWFYLFFFRLHGCVLLSRPSLSGVIGERVKSLCTDSHQRCRWGAARRDHRRRGSDHPMPPLLRPLPRRIRLILRCSPDSEGVTQDEIVLSHLSDARQFPVGTPLNQMRGQCLLPSLPLSEERQRLQLSDDGEGIFPSPERTLWVFAVVVELTNEADCFTAAISVGAFVLPFVVGIDRDVVAHFIVAIRTCCR